jgi:hypothetical protein
MVKKKKEYGYDIDDPFDRDLILDLPYNKLNSRGRKAKRKRDLIDL